MVCGYVPIRTSSSSTTTSDPVVCRNPRIHAWIRGFSRFRGRARSTGFRRDSAGDPLQMPSDADRESAQPRSGRDPQFAWAIWLTASRTTQSSASVTSCASRYQSLSLQISLRAAPIPWPRLLPRRARIEDESSAVVALRTSMPVPRRGRRRRSGISQVRAEVDLHAEQVVAGARQPGGMYGVWSVRSRRREGWF
jgi:hypothetical protein